MTYTEINLSTGESTETSCEEDAHVFISWNDEETNQRCLCGKLPRWPWQWNDLISRVKTVKTVYGNFDELSFTADEEPYFVHKLDVPD